VSAPKVTVLREIELTDLTTAIRVDRGIRSPRGALVTKVSNRVRDEIGLSEGDVIIQINNSMIASASDVARAFDNAGPSRLYIVFERGGVRYSTDVIIR
jgi:serine protease Do